MELLSLFGTSPVVVPGLTLTKEVPDRLKSYIHGIMSRTIYGLHDMNGPIDVTHDKMVIERNLIQFHVDLWAVYYYYMCHVEGDDTTAINGWSNALINQHKNKYKTVMSFMKVYPNNQVYYAHLGVKVNTVGLQYAEILPELVRTGIVLMDLPQKSIELAKSIASRELELSIQYMVRCIRDTVVEEVKEVEKDK